MFRKTLLSALLLALAVQSVRGKPSCCCPCTSTPPPPCTNPPTTEPSTTTSTTTTTQAPTTSTTSSPIKTNCVDPPAQRQPCSANKQVQCVPCTAPVQIKTPKPCEEPKNTTTSTTTTTTTTTTERPTTTTTLAPSTTTASPKSNCANGEIYPANTGSCDQFLMCRDQLYVLMVCPPGFGFNHQMKSCDWSANVPACSTQ